MTGRNSLTIKIVLIVTIIISSSALVIADTFIVTNSNDSGDGSLRQAIIAARDNSGADKIIFNIPVSDSGYESDLGVWRIKPLSQYPQMWPGGTTIDGTTQAAFIGGDPNPKGPEIVIDGSLAGNATGFYINGSNNELWGLVIQRFSYGLIDIVDDSNKVAGCYVGPDATGEQYITNYHSGISINDGSYNIIGGASEADRNVISGNELNGISIIENSTFNQVLGNYIGVNGSGADTLANSFGIRIAKSSNNIIGPNNVISGNRNDGITIQQDSENNLVVGNLIGTDISGTIAWGNRSYGIFLTGGSSNNIIGGKAPEDRNILSGNGNTGVSIHKEGSEYNQVIGNYIGTDIGGNAALPNDLKGVSISGGANNNFIGGENEGERNVISGNSGDGIWIYGDGNEGNIIQNNYIGTNAMGTAELTNNGHGLSIQHNSNNNIVGPNNVIAFNRQDGILVGNSAVGNTITQNSIYSNKDMGINNSGGGNNELSPPVIIDIGSVFGTAPPNSIIEIFSGPDDEGKNYEGTVTADGSGNFNWAGSLNGPFVTATATDDNGNSSEFSSAWHIGDFMVTTTADSGEGSLRHAIEQANISAQHDSIQFNIPISDEDFNGEVWLIQPETNLPVLESGGTIIDGFSQARNQGNTNTGGPEIVLDGRHIEGDYDVGLRLHSSENIISGLVISGFQEYGIEIYFAGTNNNLIAGNYIGTNASGTDTLGNGTGISIGGGAKNNIIGGKTTNERNVISGNRRFGVSIYADSNIVIGNYIGTDASGRFSPGNGDSGVNLGDGAKGNRIGGLLTGERNIISGNANIGVRIKGDNTKNNLVQGNYIGLNAAGDDTLGNCDGIYFTAGAKFNIIGGNEANAGNVISGNREDGIYIGVADSNTIIGNLIGTDASGSFTMGNRDNGINIYYKASYNIIGGLAEEGEGNIISGNASKGVNIGGNETNHNQLLGNKIGTDQSGAIRIPNLTGGIAIGNGPQFNQIGPDNVIRYNNGTGIVVSGNATLYNRITHNSISDNEGQGIFLTHGGNREFDAPVITSVGSVEGTVLPFAIVEIFSDSSDEGRIYEDYVVADANGNFNWAGTPAGPYVTATATDDSGNTSEFSNSFYVAVEEKAISEIPMEFSLSQNYPNPFNSETIIQFNVKQYCHIGLKVYNILGREVAQIIDQKYQAGIYQIKFNASGLPSGIYFYKIQMMGFQEVKKMVLLE